MFGRDRFSFAFIGAGSTMFTLSLLSDILHEDAITGGEFRLVDIDPVMLDKTYEAACEMVRTSGQDFKITRHTDFREALPGLDFIVFTFVTGGYDSWKTDIEICTRHGVLQSVGDTIGPGGIIRTLRNVPVVYEIAKEMEKVCPNAWAINYSNPEGALCLALQKYTKIRSFGLCHGTPDTVKGLAKEVFEVDPARVQYRAAGVNHLTWLTDLRIDGKDVYPTLRQKIVESGYDRKEPISLQLMDIFGLFPCPGDRHVEEFFPFYLTDRVLREQDYEWKNNDFEVVGRWRQEALDNLDAIATGRMTYQEYGQSGETATHFVRALTGKDTIWEMANVINRGYIENISDGVIVEVPVFVDSFGLHPQKIGRLPDGIAAKCEALGREYQLAVEAAVRGDRQLALQAMMLDPLVGHCAYPEKLLDDLLEAYRADLAESFFA